MHIYYIHCVLRCSLCMSKGETCMSCACSVCLQHVLARTGIYRRAFAERRSSSSPRWAPTPVFNSDFSRSGT